MILTAYTTLTICMTQCMHHVRYITNPITLYFHYITSHHITSHRIASRYITLHYITSHHITSHHITSHDSPNIQEQDIRCMDDSRCNRDRCMHACNYSYIIYSRDFTENMFCFSRCLKWLTSKVTHFVSRLCTSVGWRLTWTPSEVHFNWIMTLKLWPNWNLDCEDCQIKFL